MMDMHTPGPWGIDTCAMDGPSFAEIHGDSWMALARVVIRMKNADGDSAEGMANARLIAAAPDMLAVLRKTEALLTDLRVYDTGDPADAELFEEIRAIIRRIEGD